MGNPVDISKFVLAARNGDAEAFGQLYDMLVDAVYRFVYFRVGNSPDAEDITESTFVSAFEHIRTYQEKGLPFESWIYRIARNKIIDHYRGQKSRVPIEDVEHSLVDDGETPEEFTDREITNEQVMEHLKKLPDTYQEIIILKFIEEKTNEEISELLDKPIVHVRVLQSRALKKLHHVLSS